MKVLKIVAIVLISLLFTGCIDVFHYVSMDNGKVDLAVRYTIQTALINMLSEFSGEELDINELLEEAAGAVPVYEGLSFSVKPIHTSLHAGAEVRMKGDLSKLVVEEGDDYFLPIRKKDHFSILIPSMSDQDEMDEMAATFFAGASYTMLVDLRGDFKAIKEARLVYEDEVIYLNEEDSEILATIYGSTMQIEIPMVFLFSVPKDFYLELY